MEGWHRRAGDEAGQAVLEGLYTILVIMIFLFGIFALSSMVWASTVLRTTTSLAAQSALIAYQSSLHDPQLYGSETTKGTAKKDAAARAQQVGEQVMSEISSGSSFLRTLNVEATPCGAGEPLVEITPVDDGSTVTVTARTNLRWQGVAFFGAGCLRAENVASGALSSIVTVESP